MKFLGIDYGDKRVGIAVSVESGIFAFPRAVLQNTGKIFDEIKKICAEEEIEKIIVGVPISFSGGQSAQAEKVLEFAEKNGIEFELHNIADAAVAEELIKRGGKRQVPYLVDVKNATEMYESDDIIEYLRNRQS